MAGRGETCSHIAALVFFIEYYVKARETQTCTDKPNVWLPPNLKSVPFKKVKEMDFSSSNSRLAEMSKTSTSGTQQLLIHILIFIICPTNLFMLIM